MSMPNRFDEVKSLADQHPEAFPPGADNDPARLNFLTTIVIPFLNVMDNGDWGLLTKTDQGGRVPVDIIMWRDSREFVDCLTGTGAMWQIFAPAPPEWVWTPVGDPTPPTPEPPPTPPPTIHHIALKLVGSINSANVGKFVSGWDNGSLVANRNAIGIGETFEVVIID